MQKVKHNNKKFITLFKLNRVTAKLKQIKIIYYGNGKS